MVLPSLTATKEPDNIQKWHRIRTSREERDKKTRVKETASTANLETKLPLQTSVIQFNEVHDRELIPFCDLSESILYNYFSQWLKIISHSIQFMIWKIIARVWRLILSLKNHNIFLEDLNRIADTEGSFQRKKESCHLLRQNADTQNVGRISRIEIARISVPVKWLQVQFSVNIIAARSSISLSWCSKGPAIIFCDGLGRQVRLFALSSGHR